MNAKIKILGIHKSDLSLLDKEFTDVQMGKNEEGTITFLTNDEQTKQIFLDKNSQIFFTEFGFVIEGYGAIGNNIGKVSILVQSYGPNVIV